MFQELFINLNALILVWILILDALEVEAHVVHHTHDQIQIQRQENHVQCAHFNLIAAGHMHILPVDRMWTTTLLKEDFALILITVRVHTLLVVFLKCPLLPPHSLESYESSEWPRITFVILDQLLDFNTELSRFLISAESDVVALLPKHDKSLVVCVNPVNHSYFMVFNAVQLLHNFVLSQLLI